ncbi:MAG: [FeFe] hydrogenase H-cluster radical SAM maturase HydG [Christensenellales bacterium]|jgi:2-iminoacetate synthase
MKHYGYDKPFIDHDYIYALLEDAKGVSDEEIERILNKADGYEGLTHAEVAALLQTSDPRHIQRIFEIAGKIKKNVYGDRIVLFAPLYISDYCVNKCLYCGFRCDHEYERKKLSLDEVREEVKLLEAMGHKRLAVEAGEDPAHCPIDYVVDVLKTIYDIKFENGDIRRANVNIAATTIEDYKKLHEAGIGTYILFQETYHRPTYERVHVSGPKSDYFYHMTAFDRAQQAGIDDVGGGVLFGLYDYRFEVIALMLHGEHLEQEYGVGFHTISVPRIREADGADITVAQHVPSDEDFLKLVAVIRLAVPYTGMIISTRESVDMRKKLIDIGISQVSGGSTVEVGGYAKREQKSAQFEVADNRPASEIIDWLMDEGVVPSFCTACYRSGRTGDRFMALAKTGNIKNVCLPNALMTLVEYAQDYGNDAFKQKADRLVERQLPNIGSEQMRKQTAENIRRIKAGERDFYV